MPTLCELKMAIRKLDSKAKITQNKPELEALLKKQNVALNFMCLYSTSSKAPLCN